MRIILSLLAIMLLAGCTQQQLQPSGLGPQSNTWKAGEPYDYTPKTDEQVSFTLRVVDSDGNVVVDKQMASEKGQNLFLAIPEGEDGVPIGYKEYPFGAFIYQVAGVEPLEGEYLAIYVDGRYSEKGAQGIIPEEGQIIEFRVEGISAGKE